MQPNHEATRHAGVGTFIEHDVKVSGDVRLGQGVSICGPSELMAKHSLIVIGDYCDVAAFVTITTADSHRRCLEPTDEIERLEIHIEDHVFIGQGAIILGGCRIGHHSVIGAGVVLPKRSTVPPNSLVMSPLPVNKWR